MAISDIIMTNESEDYSKVLSQGYDWETFYHLSKLRQSLLNWYEFGEEDYALELQGECGALTGVLCDRCKQVISLVSNQQEADLLKKRYEKRTNLRVYVGTINDFEFPYKFDLILDVCGLETVKKTDEGQSSYVAYIDSLANLLTDKGKLLTVVENRYGIRYFCGAKEKYSGLPFFGVNQYFPEENGHLFHKKEIESILEASLLKNYKFFYPLPDYVVPQIIFTDEYMNGILVDERLNPYNVDQSTLVATERRLYRDVIDNEALSFMANSFLIECRKENQLSDIISAVVSTDRDRRECYATCIHSNQIVSKKNLFPEGAASLKKLCQNIADIAQRGIKTIEHELRNGRIEMPYVNGKKLSDVLIELSNKDAEKFVKLWDKLYQLIIQSSDLEEGTVKQLKIGYLDLVPSNIFVIDDEFYVYDQEFVKENCSAGYILYRGIKYTYMALNEEKALVSIEDLKERYHLTEQWGEFEEIERAFIEVNRQTQIYRQFYEWADSNRWIIAKRGERIGEIIV